MKEDLEKAMRQRLGIAQAVMKSHDRVVIVTSHNEADIDYLCDEVYAVRNGKVARI